MTMQVKDLKWKPNNTVSNIVQDLGQVGFQSIELAKSKDIIVHMKQEGAKIFLTFTSNMVTSGLRGLFAQLIELGMVDVICTTAGAIEEDIMKAKGEVFGITSFNPNDIALHEQGKNRVGNLYINNESYANFENEMRDMLQKVYNEKKRISVSELLQHIGTQLDDESSILYQAQKHNVPIFCPSIMDGAIGFHLYMFQQKNNDFIVDCVRDFSQMLSSTSYDDRKGIIALGGGISKHFSILTMMINGGFDYAVYMTTARGGVSGSMSGASTSEAKSWGKVKDDAHATTVNGDVSILFPITISAALDELYNHGQLDQ